MSTSITQLKSWLQLQAHFDCVSEVHMRDLFTANPNRFQEFNLTAAGITLDFSKNRICDDTLSLLIKFAQERAIQPGIQAMFDGKPINGSENRSVLHTALRNFSGRPVTVDGEDVMPLVRDTLKRMEDFCWKVRRHQWRGYGNKPFTDVVSIGIGGSFLGPKLASSALKPFWDTQIKCHYLANIDGSHITEILRHLNPETTLFIVQSKSFSTQETLKNALGCREWFLQNGGAIEHLGKHFAAVTANVEKAVEFGIEEDNIFPMWDWVGGRYSMWSAIGLPLALTIGLDAFRDLLHGAYEMDEHFRTAPLEQNLPIIMALIGIWYINFYGIRSHAILPYDHYLRGLPAHLQQLDMESNGKSVTSDGQICDYDTGPIIWGGAGSNGQHAYHQLLHQGTHFSPCDFILPLTTHNPIDEFHATLASNCFSQSQALMQGKNFDEAKAELLALGLTPEEAERLAPQRVIPGNRPSNTLFFDRATPKTIGALIALYEHKVCAQGLLWGVNSFDQWGVELGKHLGNRVLEDLLASQSSQAHDSSTNGLINAFRAMKSKL